MTYTYDTCTNGRGRLCQVQDQSGTTTSSYSVKGELVQESKVILGVTYVTGYSYDTNGNLETITYPSGRTVTYTHDLADQVSGVTTTPPGGSSQTVAANVTHNPFGGIASLTYGNGLARTVGYDQQYRITGIQTGGIQNLTYTPDNNGNILSITNNLDASKSKSFTYDALDRLWTATGPWGILGWGYDKVGNRLTQTGVDPSTYTYTTGTNRLASVTGALNKTFGYDAHGNTTTENSRTYTYNQNNRLVQATEGGILGDYVYNATEQRVVKTAGATTTVFHHDQQGQILAETQGGLTTVEYIHLDAEPLAKADGTTLSYIHPDHLATPVVMTGGAATKVWEIETRPFGDSPTVTGSAGLNLRFPGQYFELETGLHQNWYRNYASFLGRYSEPDPMGLAGGVNRYTYAGNAPLQYTDPSGLQLVIPGPPPTDPPPPGCTAKGPWRYVGGGSKSTQRAKWRLLEANPVRIPLPWPAPFQGGGSFVLFCNCIYQLTGREQVVQYWSVFQRPIECQPCRDCATCESVQEANGPPLEERSPVPVIMPVPQPIRIITAPYFQGRCQCPDSP